MLDNLRRALVESALNLLYGPLARFYDIISKAVSLGRWQTWGRALLPYLNGPDILELGHGPGHLLAALAIEGRHAVGIDLSPQMSHLAAKRLARLGFPAQVARGRAQALPFAAGTFDTVVAVFPTSYILKPETLSAARRALRPGGRMIIVPHATFDTSGALARGLEWLYRLAGRRDPVTATGNLSWNRSLMPYGFIVDVQEVRVGDSTVTLVIAERSRDA